MIVVGAGLSGMSAATKLNHYGQSVLVLEAKDRTGGRTYTQDGVDEGAAFIGPSQKLVCEAALQYRIKLKEVPIEGLFTFGLKGKVTHSKNPYDVYKVIGLASQIVLILTIKKIDKLGEEIPDVTKPWDAPNAEEWDAQTMEAWIQAECSGLSNVEDTVRFFVRILLGVEPSEISLLYYVWYVKCGGDMSTILFGAQKWNFVGGTQQLSAKMSESLPPSTVTLSHTVRKIVQTDANVTVTTDDGEEFTAEYCIVAVSPGVRNQISYSPLLGPIHHQLPQRMPMGTTMKTHMFYNDTFWAAKGYNGQATIPDGPIVSQVYDSSEPDRPCLMGFIVGDKGRSWQTQTKELRKQAICLEYARIFESDSALTPVDYVEYLEWEKDPDIGGAPTGTCPPGVLTKFNAGLREPVGRLHFAGTETATSWTGYMDGAIQAGKRAADEVLEAQGIHVTKPQLPVKPARDKRSIDCKEVLQFIANTAKEWYVHNNSTVECTEGWLQPGCLSCSS